MKFLIFILLLAFTTHSFAGDKSCTCADEFRQSVYAENSHTNENYNRYSQSYLKLGNDSEFLQGTITDNVVILIHGFIASPYEVKELAESLNNMGYSVYMPLLYGFGGDGSIANKGKLSIWRQQIKNAVNTLSKCFPKITLGGMSLGAALATDYYLSTKDKRISSLVLLSPYFDISQSIAKTLVGPLSAVKESLDLSTLFTISHSDDLVEILKNKKYYSNIMPFITLQELFTLSNELKALPANNKIKLPVFVAYSEFDTTIALPEVDLLPKKHFKNVTNFVIEKKLKVPHQIIYRTSNPKFDDMVKKIKRFVWTSNLIF
jgi:esterase/lipase